jgi:5-methylcytosine-specific restriction protein A
VQRHLKLIHDLIKGKPAHLRSPKWHRVEQEHLAKEPCCQWCGATEKLQVHHITPFHLAAALELDPFNLITLCEEGGRPHKRSDAKLEASHIGPMDNANLNEVRVHLNCHLYHGHNGDWKSFNDKVLEQCDLHKLSPNAQLLEAIRKQDPDLYKWLVNSKMEKKHGTSSNT